MMAQMSGRMGMGAMNRKSNRKGKKGKKGKGRGPTPPKAARGGFPGMPGGMPAGFPDLSNMPAGLDQLPPGLEGIDVSQFQQPKKKK